MKINSQYTVKLKETKNYYYIKNTIFL